MHTLTNHIRSLCLHLITSRCKDHLHHLDDLDIWIIWRIWGFWGSVTCLIAPVISPLTPDTGTFVGSRDDINERTGRIDLECLTKWPVYWTSMLGSLAMWTGKGIKASCAFAIQLFFKFINWMKRIICQKAWKLKQSEHYFVWFCTNWRSGWSEGN